MQNRLGVQMSWFEILLSKLKEPSSWRGLAIVLGVFGYSVAPGMVDTIAAAVGGVIGVIEMVRSDSDAASTDTKVP